MQNTTPGAMCIVVHCLLLSSELGCQCNAHTVGELADVTMHILAQVAATHYYEWALHICHRRKILQIILQSFLQISYIPNNF